MDVMRSMDLPRFLVFSQVETQTLEVQAVSRPVPLAFH